MKKIYSIIFLFILLNLYINENNFIRNELINEKKLNLRNGLIYNNDKKLNKNEVHTNIESNESNVHESEHKVEGKDNSKGDQEKPKVEDITYKKKDVDDSEIPFSGSDIQGTYQFSPTSGRNRNRLPGTSYSTFPKGNIGIPPSRKLSGEEGFSYPLVFTSHKESQPQRPNTKVVPHISGRRGIHTYSSESGESKYIDTSRSNIQKKAKDLTGKTEKVTSGEKTKSEKNQQSASDRNSPKTSPYDNMLGWEFGGGAPKNGAEEDKKTKPLLEQIKIPSWDRDNIPDENEQVKEDPQVGNIYEEEETEDLETEDDENEEIEENEKDEVDEEDGEEMEEKTKEEKQDNKIIDESKEEQNNNSSSDINAQNLISNEHKKNNEAKKTSENIVKTLIELFNEKNEIDSTINNLVQEMVELFSNN